MCNPMFLQKQEEEMRKRGRKVQDRVSIEKQRRLDAKLEVYSNQYMEHQKILVIVQRQKQRLMN